MSNEKNEKKFREQMPLPVYLKSANDARDYIAKNFKALEEDKNIVQQTTVCIPREIKQQFGEKFGKARPVLPTKTTINDKKDSQNIAASFNNSKIAVMSCANGDFILGGFRIGDGSGFHGTQEESLGYTTALSSFLEQAWGEFTSLDKERYPLGRYKYKESLLHDENQRNALYTRQVPCFALADNVQGTLKHLYRIISKPFTFNVFSIAGFDLRETRSIRQEKNRFMKKGAFDWQQFKAETKTKYDLFFQTALLNGDEIAIPGALSCGAFVLTNHEEQTQRMVAEAFAESALEYEGFIHIEIPILGEKLARIFSETLESKRKSVGLDIKNLLPKTENFKDVQLDIRLLPQNSMQIALANDDPQGLKLLADIAKYIPGIEKVDDKTVSFSKSALPLIQNYLRTLAPRHELGITSLIAATIFQQLPEDQKQFPQLRLTDDHALIVKIGEKETIYKGFMQIHEALKGIENATVNFYAINPGAMSRMFLDKNQDISFLTQLAQGPDGIKTLQILESIFAKMQVTTEESFTARLFGEAPHTKIIALQKVYLSCLSKILQQADQKSLPYLQHLTSTSPLMKKGVLFGQNKAEELVNDRNNWQNAPTRPK